MSLKVATFNANSVRARQGIILDWLKRESPDILCLQETKVQDKAFPAGVFQEAGYQIAFRGQKGYNGVAVASRLPLRDLRLDLGSDGPDQEARFMSARLEGFALVNVYAPQGYAVGTDRFEHKLKWLEELLEHLRSTYDPEEPLLVAGDFNVALEPRDVYDPEGLDGRVCFHPAERELMRGFLDWGLVDVLRKYEPGEGVYTFWDYRVPNALKRNLGWRIDYILATRPLAEASTSVRIDVEARRLEKPSDHTFLVAEFR